MFGSDPFGSVPFGATGASPPDYEAMLTGTDEMVYTAEITVWNIATDTEEKLYLATSEWATSPTDIPPSTEFDGRLTTALSFSRSIAGDRIGTNHSASEGSIVFSNPDGAYDDYVTGYSVDGRAVVVRVGRKTDAFADHLVIFRGVAVDMSGDDNVTIAVRDKGFLLDVPAAPDTYAGTGDAEGGINNKGKRKPVSFGDVSGIEPVQINTTLLIYQMTSVSLSPTFSISLVIDRGVNLTIDATDYADYAALAGASVSSGHAAISNATGLIRLGASASGIIIVGVAGGGVGVSPTVADIIRSVIDHATDLGDADIDKSSFDAITLAQSAGTAIYVGPDDASTVEDVIKRLMAGVGGWAGFNRNGELSLGILTAPTGDPVAYFDRDEGDIIALASERLPSAVWPPPWQVRVTHDKNWTVFTDFAGSVPEVAKAFYAEPYRVEVAEDAGVLTDHAKAQELPIIETGFDDDGQTPAQTEAARILALFTAGYRLWRMTVDRRGLARKLGEVIHVTYPRFGFDAGKLVAIVGITDRIELADGSGVEKVELLVFG